MGSPVRVAPMRMTSLSIASALTARSPIANGIITHIATSANRAPNLVKLRFAFFCFIFITFLFPWNLFEPYIKESFPVFGHVSVQCGQGRAKDRQMKKESLVVTNPIATAALNSWVSPTMQTLRYTRQRGKTLKCNPSRLGLRQHGPVSIQ